jgi:hypothetical protein
VYTKQVDASPSLIASGNKVSLNFGAAKPMPELRDQRQGSGFFAAIEGPVRDAAIVYINGKRAGAVFSPPYSLDVTGLLQEGSNDIRVEVGNTQVNWLAVHGFPNYDYKALVKEFGNRFSPAKPSDFVTQPSGLLGPVQLISQPVH